MKTNLKLYVIFLLVFWGMILLGILANGVRAAGVANSTESVTFAWDLNDPADEVEYYTLYSGDAPGGPYHAELDSDVPPATIQVDIPPGACKYFVVTASSALGESGPSNEVSKCISAESPEPTPGTSEPAPDSLPGPTPSEQPPEEEVIPEPTPPAPPSPQPNPPTTTTTTTLPKKTERHKKGGGCFIGALL